MVVWGRQCRGGEEAGGGKEGKHPGAWRNCGDNGYVHDLDYSDGLTILYMSKPIKFYLKYVRCIVYQLNFNKVFFKVCNQVIVVWSWTNFCTSLYLSPLRDPTWTIVITPHKGLCQVRTLEEHCLDGRQASCPPYKGHNVPINPSYSVFSLHCTFFLQKSENVSFEAKGVFSYNAFINKVRWGKMRTHRELKSNDLASVALLTTK